MMFGKGTMLTVILPLFRVVRGWRSLLSRPAAAPLPGSPFPDITSLTPRLMDDLDARMAPDAPVWAGARA